jgi:hypothetical protein
MAFRGQEVNVVGRVFWVVASVGLWLGLTVHADAQSAFRPQMITVSGGLFNYDLSGTGNTAAVSVAADWALIGNWSAGPALTVARPQQQFSDRTTFLLPEAEFKYEFGSGRISPFAGGGVGAAIDVRNDQFGGTRTDLALSAGGGLRAALSESFGVRGEFRLRTFGSNFSGSAAEVRGGMYWRF